MFFIPIIKLLINKIISGQAMALVLNK